MKERLSHVRLFPIRLPHFGQSPPERSPVGLSMAGQSYPGWGPVRAGAILVVMALAACTAGQPPPGEEDTLRITVSIAPQQYFVERIGGDYVTVKTMVPPGTEPHTYEPRPEQLKALSQADAYMRIRIDFEEAWMERFAAVNPDMVIVDTTAGIQRLPLPSEVSQGANTPPGPENVDPHIWLSPRLVTLQAQTMYEVMAQLDQEHQPEFARNLAAFQADIAQLDDEIRQTLTGVQPRAFLVFHPAWGYFARDYDLQMLSVEVGGQEPSATELTALIQTAQQEQIKVIFAEPQFSQRSAQTIAQEIGGEVLLLDPLAYDWLGNLQEVAETFARVMGEGGDGR